MSLQIYPLPRGSSYKCAIMPRSVDHHSDCHSHYLFCGLTSQVNHGGKSFIAIAIMAMASEDPIVMMADTEVLNQPGLSYAIRSYM